MSTAFDVPTDTDFDFGSDADTNKERATSAAEFNPRQTAKNNARLLVDSVLSRMKRSPERVQKLANDTLARKDLLHGEVSGYLETRNDPEVMRRVALRFGCSQEEAELVLDHIALTRSMSSDYVGVGTKVL